MLRRHVAPSTGSKSSGPVRLIGCQGSVQLAAALAAVRTHAELHPEARRARNHLAIYHLSSPAGQDVEFARCIEELAESAAHWERITYLSQQQTVDLRQTWKQHGWEAACAQMRSFLGLEHVDELFLNQVITYGSCVLSQSYPEANLIGFGDGVGMNYSRNYIRAIPEAAPITWREVFRRVERTVRRIRRGVKEKGPRPGEEAALPDIDPKQRYLLLPNLLDHTARRYHPIAPQTLAEVFAQFSQLPALINSPDVVQAENGLREASEAVILLTSNYAETRRMSLEGEIRSYCELVEESAPYPRSLVIIKPHPRDSRDKINTLRQRLEARYRQVLLLDEPVTFYAPLEALVSRWVESIPAFNAKTTMICVSSSCLGLEYLYGCHTILGFGKERVHSHFEPQWRQVRMRHERDLVGALRFVRRRTVARAA